MLIECVHMYIKNIGLLFPGPPSSLTSVKVADVLASYISNYKFQFKFNLKIENFKFQILFENAFLVIFLNVFLVI